MYMLETVPSKGISLDTPAWVNRLPNELLSEIFLCMHTRFISELGYREYYHGPPPCASLSHVCQRWRNVAIACQRLWSLFPCRSSEWTRACISRAHSIPVDLNIETVEPTPMQQSTRLALPSISRAKTLDVHIQVRVDHHNLGVKRLEALRALAMNAAPLLEELQISINQYTPCVPYVPTSVHSLFHEETPAKLRRISLDGCALQPTCSIFSSALTHLALIDTILWSDVDQMIEFFIRVPLLESFIFLYPSGASKHGFNTEPSHV